MGAFRDLMGWAMDMNTGANWILATAAAAILAGAASARAQETREPLVPVQPNAMMTVDVYLGAINGEPVFLEDVLAPIESDLRRTAKVSSSVTEFKQEARDIIGKQLAMHVSDLLMLKAAKDSLNEDEQKRIDAFMNKTSKDLITQYGGSAVMADTQLRREKGITLEKQLALVKRKAMIEMYLSKTLWPKIQVTRSMVQAEYDRRKTTQFTQQAEVDLYTITIPIKKYLKEADPNRPGETRDITNPSAAQLEQAKNLAVEHARQLITQIKAGKNFAELAENESKDVKAKQGGRWPHTKKGMLAREEVEKAAFSLPPNSVAEPVAIMDKDLDRAAVVIVKVEEVKAERTIGFPDAQAQIEREIKDMQFVKLTKDYYDKLRAKAAGVDQVQGMLEASVDAAITRYAMK